MDKTNTNTDINIDLKETQESKVISVEKKYDKKQKYDKSDYMEKYCKVINYDKKNKSLDIKFGIYGIRISNVQNYDGKKFVNVKYKGEIGKPNFEYKL